MKDNKSPKWWSGISASERKFMKREGGASAEIAHRYGVAWIIYNIVLVIDLGLVIGILLLPRDTSFNRFTYATDEDRASEASDLDFIQTAASAVCLLLSGAAVILGLASLLLKTTLNVKAIGAMKFFEIFADILLLAYPTTTLMILAIIVMVLHVGLVLGAAAFYHVMSKKQTVEELELLCLDQKDNDVLTDEYLNSCDIKDVVKNVKKVSRWTQLRMQRREHNDALNKGRVYFFWICFLVILLAAGTYVFEFRKIISSQGEFFSENLVESMSDESNINSTFGDSRTHSNYRVVLLIFDGMRYDMMTDNANLTALLNTPSIKQDSYTQKMINALPSMSVPNWLTILTGVNPDLTGVLGNLLIPETGYDSIFREAANFKLWRGLTASPWMADIVRSQLPFLAGDGSVPTSVGAKGLNYPTADPADWKRAETMEWAVKRTEQPYEFFLGHFSDIDMQGHALGVKVQWNKDDTYNKAVANKTLILKSLLDIVDNRTVVIMTADHGHVDRGGHGGTPSSLRETPFWIYLKDSNLNLKLSSWPAFAAQPMNVDIAPTVCALLGIPVPRQCLGVFNDKAMSLMGDNTTLAKKHMLDLFRQKQKLVASFYSQLKATIPDTQAALIGTDYPNENSEWYKSKVKVLQGYMNEARSSQIITMLVRNILLTIVIEILIVGLVFFVAQRYTFCNPASIFVPSFGRLGLDKYVSADDDETVTDQEKVSSAVADALEERATVVRKANVKAFILAFALVLIFMGGADGLYILLYFFYGYYIWESTVIHTPAVVPTYFMYVLVPSVVLAFLIHRFYHLIYMKWETKDDVKDDFRRRMMKVGHLFSSVNANFGRDLDSLYLVKHYLLLHTVLLIMTIFIVFSTFSFILPYIFRITFIEELIWGLRFRALTIMLMSFALMFTAVYGLKLPKFDDCDNYHDEVFLMGMLKTITRAAKRGVGVGTLCKQAHGLLMENTRAYQQKASAVDFFREDPLVL